MSVLNVDVFPLASDVSKVQQHSVLALYRSSIICADRLIIMDPAGFLPALVLLRLSFVALHPFMKLIHNSQLIDAFFPSNKTTTCVSVQVNVGKPAKNR